MADPILDLTTVLEPVHVRIDGVPHRLWHSNNLTLAQTVKLEDLGPRVQDLFVALRDDKLDAAGEQELDEKLAGAVRIVLDAPPAVHARLSQKQRFEILRTFMRLSLPGAETPETPAAASPSTGASNSPDSPASTLEPASIGG
jgi:hypothetical protein